MTGAAADAPSDTLWWEDFPQGRSWHFGECEVMADEIIAFAARYDPLPMHAGPEVAAQTPLGMFCASGIHTFAMAQRMICDNLFGRAALHAGGAVDSFRMRRPVLPGDRLHVRMRVVTATLHRHQRDRGWCRFRVEVMRAGDEVVLDYLTDVLFVRRAGAEGIADNSDA